MKIAVWKTNHAIADTVAEAIKIGIPNAICCDASSTNQIERFAAGNSERIDGHVGYGILRGMSAVFNACDKAGKPWFNIDRAYWKPGHYDGYYRVSLHGTQQTTGLDKLEPDYARWDRLGLDCGSRAMQGDKVLVCPPTDHVHDFFNLGERWTNNSEESYGGNAIVRNKGSSIDLQEDLNRSKKVYTFNSSVGWEALRQGIPVVSDPTHSIVGAYQKMLDRSIHDDYNERRRLFSIMAGLQLTLEEMKQGLLWPLLNRLLSI